MKKPFFRLTSLDFSPNIPDFDCKICLASRKNGILPCSKPSTATSLASQNSKKSPRYPESDRRFPRPQKKASPERDRFERGAVVALPGMNRYRPCSGGGRRSHTEGWPVCYFWVHPHLGALLFCLAGLYNGLRTHCCVAGHTSVKFIFCYRGKS